jgi:hypothetical protein
MQQERYSSRYRDLQKNPAHLPAAGEVPIALNKVLDQGELIQGITGKRIIFSDVPNDCAIPHLNETIVQTGVKSESGDAERDIRGEGQTGKQAFLFQ